MFLFVYLFIYLFTYLFIYLFIGTIKVRTQLRLDHD